MTKQDLSDERLDEIMNMTDQKSDDEMIEWIELQPDKDLIVEYFNAFIDNPIAYGETK